MSGDGAQPPLTRAEERVRRAEQQQVEASRVRAEIEAAKVAEVAKTARLRALRLAKEAAERETAAAAPKKPAGKHK